jgi:hypothetical protein
MQAGKSKKQFFAFAGRFYPSTFVHLWTALGGSRFWLLAAHLLT